MGLAGAGERSQRKPLFLNLMRKHVFDIGCGYGWQCKFAAEQGVMCVLGIDRSTKMIAEAQRRNADVRIEYRVCRIEKYEYRAEKWDCVISNLASHASLTLMQFIKSASDTETFYLHQASDLYGGRSSGMGLCAGRNAAMLAGR